MREVSSSNQGVESHTGHDKPGNNPETKPEQAIFGLTRGVQQVFPKETNNASPPKSFAQHDVSRRVVVHLRASLDLVLPSHIVTHYSLHSACAAERVQLDVGVNNSACLIGVIRHL